MKADLGFQATLNTRVTRPKLSGRVRHITTPFGRVAFTRDRGGAGLFDMSHILLSTSLTAAHRDPDGRLVREYALGSGKVTNVGVLALCYDALAFGKAKEPFTTFFNLKYHGWGTGSGTENEKDIKLETPATWEGGAATKAKKETSYTVSTNGEGKPKLVSVCKLVWPSAEAGEAAIKEWGIFTAETLEASTGSPLTSASATTGKTTGTALTASSEEAKGERLLILEAEKNSAAEAKPVWGLITENSTSVVTVPAWYQQSTGAVKEPEATSAYKLRPVMFDHRTFAVINLSKGNSVEFTWELTVQSGG